MLSEINSEINQLSISLGLGKCLQHELIVDDRVVNVDFNENCYLYCGDNLYGLLNLTTAHPNSIGFCYIDPPYNCSTKVIYHDNRKGSDTGVWGKHSEWMEFMLPRLVAARLALKEDGAIAISIDDYEFPYLKVLMDKIFGEENFIGNVIVCRSKNGKGSKKNIATSHEYLVVYGKSKSAVLRGSPASEEDYDKSDENGLYRIDGLFRKKGQGSLREERPSMHYPLYYNEQGEVFLEPGPNLTEVFPVDSKGIERRWLWGVETARKRTWQLYASPNGVVYVKNYLTKDKRKKIRTIWDSKSYYTERGTIELKKIFGDKVFDTPKPLTFIEDIIDQMSKPDDLILDFFAGSGTTAHAAHQLNLKDGGNRRVILMESNDLIPEKHIAKKQFDVISDITAYRLGHIAQNNTDYKYIVDSNESTPRQVNLSR